MAPEWLSAGLFIKFFTEPGDLVLDPFAGSITTDAAAEELERHLLAIEPERCHLLPVIKAAA
jgi:DNA modification methylase